MQDIVRLRLLLFLSTLIVVPVITVMVIMFARGYRANLQNGEISVTGLLVAHSYPDSAQVIVNGQVKSATNTTVTLTPGKYQVEIKKEGFYPWKKDLTIEPEIVTRATAVLFPSVPVLKPVTTAGATSPQLSPDGTKIVYYSSDHRNLYMLDLSESPLGLFNRESKLLTRLASASKLVWSPDSRQVLAIASPSALLIDVNSQNVVSQITNPTAMLNSWKQRTDTTEAEKFDTLPVKLKDILATASADLVWSPREDKLLYTATASAVLPVGIVRPLPGSSTQPQERTLIPNSVYVYDLEEDRNFLIDQTIVPSPTAKAVTKTKTKIPATTAGASPSDNAGWLWFPTSSHLYKLNGDKIIVKEYDGQNLTVIYAGQMSEKVAIAYPSGKQMLIVSTLDISPTPGSSSAVLPNLYALTLR